MNKYCYITYVLVLGLLQTNVLDGAEIEGIDENLALNQVQFIGTTNSYRIAPSDQMKYALVDIADYSFVPSVAELQELFSYSHKSLTDQLDMGVRYFDFRVYADPGGRHYSNPKIVQEASKRNISVGDIFHHKRFDLNKMEYDGFKVFHMPDYDFLSTCYLLSDCLQEMYNWTQIQQNDHLPIIVTVEIMSNVYYFEQKGLTAPVQMEEPIDALENEIRYVLKNKIFRRSFNKNVDQTEQSKSSHQSYGWPKISDIKNKFIFFIKKSSMPFSFVQYLNEKPKLENKRVFYNTISPNETGILERDIGVVYIDDPAAKDLSALVRAGFLVATRSELQKGFSFNTYVRDMSFASGAQFITTKYPKYADYGASMNNYYASFKNDALVRKNVVKPLVGSNQVDDFPGLIENSTMRINQVQYIGTQDSYRVGLTPDEFRVISMFTEQNAQNKFIRPQDIRNYRYSHQALSLQLDMGVRQLELSIYSDTSGSSYAQPKIYDVAAQLNTTLIDYSYDPSRQMDMPGFKVMHELDFDQNSHCYLLKDCLLDLKAWSDQNKNHSFIFVVLQLQQVKQKPNGAVPEAYTPQTLTLLDEIIRHIFGGDKLIVPDDLKQFGKYATVSEAIQDLKQEVWPSLYSAKGKFMFGMTLYEKVYDMFTMGVAGHENLKGRVMFPGAKLYQMANQFLNTDGVAWVQFDEIINYKIKEYVEKGYLVRVRSEEPIDDGILNNTTRRDTALNSGAHFISTNYPKSPYYQTRFSDYHVVFPNEAFSRENIITCDESCTPATQPHNLTLFKDFYQQFQQVTLQSETYIQHAYQNIIGKENCQGFPGSQTGQYFLMMFVGVGYALLQCCCIRGFVRKSESVKKN